MGPLFKVNLLSAIQGSGLRVKLPLPGITGGHNGDRRVDFIIPKDARHKGELDIVIEVSCNECVDNDISAKASC